MSEPQDLVGCGYDAVYEAFPNSPTLRRLWRDNAAGPDFPDAFYHISFLTLVELTRMSAELRLTGEMTRGSRVRHGRAQQLDRQAIWGALDGRRPVINRSGLRERGGQRGGVKARRSTS